MCEGRIGSIMVLTKEDLQAIEGLFDGRFGAIDKRFGAIDKQFKAIDKRFEAMDKRFEAMDQRFDKMDERFDKMDERLNKMDLRLEHVESDVSSLKVGQRMISEKLQKVSDKVDATYELALENWGQIEESKVRLAILEG